MRIFFENADDLYQGITEVACELDLALCTKEEAQLCVTVQRTEERMLRVVKEGSEATVTYGDGRARFFRALADLLVQQNNLHHKRIYEAHRPNNM